MKGTIKLSDSGRRKASKSPNSTRTTRTISFQPLQNVRIILERIRVKRGLKFTSALINEAIVRHFADEIRQSEKTGEIKAFLDVAKN
jgi:hypothetical protein